MAFGKYCPVCRGIVDRNEYNFLSGMCNECVIETEMQERRRIEVTKMLNSNYQQMTLNV